MRNIITYIKWSSVKSRIIEVVDKSKIENDK